MAEKVTTMVLKVKLHCPSCYKKIKKVLAKFPQIRTQAYDKKQNTVTITVVCCDPQKFRDKLCCKGGKIIESIEIQTPKSEETEKDQSKRDPDKTEKKRDSDTDQPPSSPPDHPVLAPALVLPPIFYPVPVCCGTCYGCNRGGPCYQVCCGICYGCYRGGICYQVCYGEHRRPTCCGQCYEGIPGGPCYQGCRRPVPCYEYCIEENTPGCTLM